jgi:hypothetical protein
LSASWPYGLPATRPNRITSARADGIWDAVSPGLSLRRVHDQKGQYEQDVFHGLLKNVLKIAMNDLSGAGNSLNAARLSY